MKKFQKQFISIITVISILICMSVSVCAVEPTVLSCEYAERVLLDFGYPQKTCNALTDEIKHQIATQIQKNPEEVVIETIDVPIDELYWIELIVNLTEEELLKIGLTKEDVLFNKSNINQINQLSDEELKNEYERTEEEIKLMRMAMKKKENYKMPKNIYEDDKVTASTINSTTMSYTQTYYNNKAATGKAVSYCFNIAFAWSRHPAITFLKDKIAVNWGCDLASMSESGTVRFTNGNSSSARLADVERYPNSGLIFSFWQRSIANDGIGWDVLSSGTMNFTVYQTSKRGLSADLISQYGHGIATITGGGVSIGAGGGSVGIDFGLGFDTSEQLRNTLSV